MLHLEAWMRRTLLSAGLGVVIGCAAARAQTYEVVHRASGTGSDTPFRCTGGCWPRRTARSTAPRRRAGSSPTARSRS